MRRIHRRRLIRALPLLLALLLSLPAGAEHVWARRDESRPQLAVSYLDAEIILSGARKTPELYYLNMDRQPQLYGEYLGQGAALEADAGLYGVGLFVWDGERTVPLVHTGDTLAVYGENGRVYAAAADAEALYAGAEAILGYKPGTLDFQGRACVKAALLWQGKQNETAEPAAMRRMEEILAALRPLPSGASCPFDMILRLTFEDGAQADLFLATDSCDTLFYHGAVCQYSGQRALLALFGL